MARTQLSVGVDDPGWREDVASEPIDPRRHRTRWLVIGLVILLLGAACYCVAAAALSRQDYGTFAFWDPPRRVHYCGRTYFPAGVVRGPASVFTSEVDPSAEAHWETVGHTFSLRRIEAPVLGRRGLSAVCAMAVDVPVDGGRFQSYGLSGGP